MVCRWRKKDGGVKWADVKRRNVEVGEVGEEVEEAPGIR